MLSYASIPYFKLPPSVNPMQERHLVEADSPDVPYEDRLTTVSKRTFEKKRFEDNISAALRDNSSNDSLDVSSQSISPDISSRSNSPDLSPRSISPDLISQSISPNRNEQLCQPHGSSPSTAYSPWSDSLDGSEQSCQMCNSPPPSSLDVSPQPASLNATPRPSHYQNESICQDASSCQIIIHIWRPRKAFWTAPFPPRQPTMVIPSILSGIPYAPLETVPENWHETQELIIYSVEPHPVYQEDSRYIADHILARCIHDGKPPLSLKIRVAQIEYSATFKNLRIPEQEQKQN